MGNTEIREPKQQRSIEKKKKIIESAFELFCEKGFHNTNTAEIAKHAGVSTGIVYNYFENKKDIFISAIGHYSDTIMAPVFDGMINLSTPINLPEVLDDLIDTFVKYHYVAKDAHEEMLAMAHSDKDIGAYFNDFEMKTTNYFVDILKQHGITPPNPYEKVHIAYNIIEDFCHEVAYHKHKELNYDFMKEEVVKIISTMLST